MSRIVMHVDMDAFYASVEVRENPMLRGSPVIVGADPKGGRGRGVVVSCTYEARRFGIRSATPISRAYALCPDAVYLRPRFLLYERVSEKIMRLLKGYADRFEQVSIDEAYLDVTERAAGFEEAEALARRIKEEVFRREGITCSIGVASSRVVAKIASDFRKPDGLAIVEPSETRIFLDSIPVSRIPGVGRKTTKELEQLGVQTIGGLARQPRDKIVKRFGKHGAWIWEAASGIDDSVVGEGEEVKSIGAEHTFEHDVGDMETVLGALGPLVDDVHARLAYEKCSFRNVGVKIRFSDFTTITRSKSLPGPTAAKDMIARAAGSLLNEFREDHRGIRLIGVRVFGLRKGWSAQKTLLP